MDIITYHDATKHYPYRYARSLGYLDWESQPNPFRFYQKAKRIPLEFYQETKPLPYPDLYTNPSEDPAVLNHETIADFFRHALGLSAWKSIQTARWALRVNPSSGNLHPTEGYVILPAIEGWCEKAGVYHYVPESHAIEIRGSFAQEAFDHSFKDLPSGSFLVGITSIHWRESWKYGERAFRYCQHDTGHAIAALALSARLKNWHMQLLYLPMALIASIFGTDRANDFHENEHEEPECLALITPEPVNIKELKLDFSELCHEIDFHGQANTLSPDHFDWPIIDEATKITRTTENDVLYQPDFPFDSPLNIQPKNPVDAKSIILQRRSAVDFDGKSSTDINTFSHILAQTLPGNWPPFNALYWPPKVHLVLFVHRVEGLEQGMYCLVRDPKRLDFLRSKFRPEFQWIKPENIPSDLPLYLLDTGNCVGLAAGLSCQQAIAGDSFFSLGMIAEFEEPIQEYGPWFYRNLFWETGIIGQVLYLEAEAAGARSTGIGCFFDDPVHEVLGIQDHSLQSLYHFTIGIPVDDPRLTTEAAYSRE